jgi:catechol 2,3-dioxygenase-like lactoylglutathione lyase family enzyme
MLTQAPVMTMIPVVDIDRARKFYDQLGLTYKTTLANGNVLYACNGATLALFQRSAPTRAEHTALSFEVTDIRSEIAALRQRGVVFEEYDLPDFKTVDSVCVLGAERAAWFKDSEGNILCIHQDR